RAVKGVEVFGCELVACECAHVVVDFGGGERAPLAGVAVAVAPGEEAGVGPALFEAADDASEVGVVDAGGPFDAALARKVEVDAVARDVGVLAEEGGEADAAVGGGESFGSDAQVGGVDEAEGGAEG